MSAPPEPGRCVPLRGARRVIARRMHESLRESAQLTFHAYADVTARVAARRAGSGASVEDAALWALARALCIHPEANAVLSAEEAFVAERVNVAIALQSPQGLVAPVLRDAASKTLVELATERAELVARARAGRLGVSELKGGTATLSNLGHSPVTWFTPILHGGQALLLGLGRLETRLALGADGRIVQQRLLPLSLTADHRWLDGEPAGRFLATLCDALSGGESGRAGDVP